MRHAMRLKIRRVADSDKTREKLRSFSRKVANEPFGVGRNGCGRGLPQENRTNGKVKMQATWAINAELTGQIWKFARQSAGKKGSMGGFIYWR
jgi:hypothetical protein